MFHDANVLNVIKNTFIYGICSTLFQNIFGLMFALLVDQKIRGRNFLKILIYLPAIISALIMGYVWYYFFQYNGGAINDVLALFSIAPVDWLSDGSRAVWIITGVNTFQFVGVAMIIYLAGLQNIPTQYYEAAEMDGATGLKKFQHVTLPLLMPAITVSVVDNIIGGLKLFDVIMAMTKGGPGYSSHSLSTMMYNLYFVRQNAGYAAAIGNLMFLIICIISVFTLKCLKSKEVEM
ncbi:carbohydrate ABC transporter permease [Caproiciproducens sp.]|uniref:carbohydrate ABC transporter permease n=1 Tax=Caproiciproducens sp. TaxID=1954376 RepID=UPI00289B2A97|nr:sugar ABC transporter permease [Caproiciproducens sp.]